MLSSNRIVRACLLGAIALLAGGCSWPSFLVTPVGSPGKIEEKVVQAGKGWSPKKIAIIEVEGMLINAKEDGFLQPTENPMSRFKQQLDTAADDDAVAAVVLRVNSPGGTVTTSDAMYQELLRFRTKTKKPVIASAQEVAASGAYYVACAADKIVVQPTSIIGSIGVVFYTFDVSGTMAKIGARAEAVKSGPLKGMGSPFHPMTDTERAVMQQMIDEYYGRFIAVVRTRPLTELPTTRISDYQRDSYAGVFSGRVWSGQSAVQMGLADQTGLLEDAIDLAKSMSGAKDASVVLYKRPYGYSGSIYASDSTPQPRAGVLRLELPQSEAFLPSGFYYLWRP